MSNRNPGGGTQDEGVESVAVVLALGAMFVGGAPLYRATIDWAQLYAINNYGYGLDLPVSIGWGVACAVLLYGVTRLVVGIVLTLLRGTTLFKGGRLLGWFR